ncbi:Uma2 family endonuclease [Polyangium sp. 6x1]|uniref:Uma2 family endonuclease n=1 Tax=Polyangium sp. 6x1 TaxID=3042689 RepID=UPI00248291BD|nr:Uma2 family endonuclease [Polyangium sp. 6x1]MDI1451745.1 Uma2 family endonuclease [Polyangium sp. 6x1]
MSDPARTAKRPKTWEDLEDVPEGFVGEIVDGELVLVPVPNPPHSRARTRLMTILGGPFDLGRDGPGGWVVRSGHIQFGEEVRRPDLAAWRVERFEQLDDGPFTAVPDWICEVVEKAYGRTDRVEKSRLYAKHGVRHYWIVDPAIETLEVYRLEGKTWVVAGAFGGDECVRLEPFEAIEIQLAWLWKDRPFQPSTATP